MKISAGIHIKSQVNDYVPQEDSVTQSQKPPTTVSRLAPVLFLIKARQHYIALAQEVVLSQVMLMLCNYLASGKNKAFTNSQHTPDSLDINL